MSESFSENLHALQEQQFVSPLERYNAWKRLVEDPRVQSASAEERFTLYNEAASALSAIPAVKEPGGLDQLIALTQAMVESAPRDDPSLHGQAEIELSKVLACRAAQSHESSDLEACRKHAEAMLHIVPQDDWRYPLYVLAEATVYYVFTVKSDDTDYADKAIARLQAARSRLRQDSSVFFGTASAFLADICVHRYIQTGDQSLLEEAIVSGIDFCDTERPRHGERFLALVSLSRAFRRRFELYLKRKPADIVRAVHFADKALGAATTVDERIKAYSVRGTGYRLRFERMRDASDLDKALESNRRAIDLVGEGGDPSTVATLLDQYANCLSLRYHMFKHKDDLQTSIKATRKALSLMPAGDPFGNRGTILKNLGISLLQLGRDKDDSLALSEAESTLREALAHVGSKDDLQAQVRKILAEVYLELAAGCPARDRPLALERALAELDAARETLDRSWMHTAEYELGLRGLIASIAEAQVGVSLCLREIGTRDKRAHWLKRALAAGESAKAGLLANELLRTIAAPPPDVPDSVAQSEQLLLANLARLEGQELRHLSDERTDPLHIARMRLRAKIYLSLQEKWSEMASMSAAAADYVAMRRGHPHDWIGGLPGLRAGCVCIAVIPFTDPPRARELSANTDDVPATFGVSKRRRLAIIAISAALSEPAIVISAGDDPLPDALHTFVRQVPIEAPWARRAETWHDALVPLVSDLAAVAGPVEELLISPSREGLSLPWHLVVARAGWKTLDGRSMPVTTVPTLKLVWSVRARPANHTRWHVATDAREFSLDDPDGLSEAMSMAIRVPVEPADGPAVVIGDPSGDLRGARGEAEAAARVLGVKPLIGGDACSKTVLSALSRARVIHLATHARLNADEPLKSFLYLYDRNVTVRDLLGLRSAAELIVLSACESGVGSNLRGEEILGVAYVLLRCGAREIIASLWRVDDDATGALMSKFHELRPAVGSPAALAAAMASIGSTPKWSEPYYWAGFILLATGDTFAQY